MSRFYNYPSDVDRDQKGKQQHGGTPEAKVALGCGCVYMSETGLPVAYCKGHDRRTSRVKVGAALADLANWLDEASLHLRAWALPKQDILINYAGEDLKSAAQAAMKASKAIIGGDDDI